MDRGRKERVRGTQQSGKTDSASLSAKQRDPSNQQGTGSDDGSGGFQLFIMRHGIATDRSGRYASNDAKRPLTPRGRKRTEQIATGLLSLGYGFDWIVTSPLVRARETAEIVASSTRKDTPLDQCPALRPGGSYDDLLSFLDKKPNSRRVLLVGHEPDLSTMASRLIGAGPAANLIFKKGGCCLIHCDASPSQSAGRLVWWLTPRLLRSFR